MNITFYNTTSPGEALYKKLNNAVTISGEARDIVDVENPTFVIEGIDFTIYNYFYVSDLKRYYFIANRTGLANGLVQITGVTDPLMSFQTQIANLNLLIDTSTTYYDSYYGNGAYKFKCYPRLQTRRFSNDVAVCSGNDYVMVTNAGPDD